MGRYNLICKFDDVLEQKECPIVLLSAALTKDMNSNAVLVQIKFQNIDWRIIKAVYVSIKCIGIDKKTVIEDVKYTYLDLSVKQQEIFGANIPVYLNSIETRNIQVSCLKIIFFDDSSWENLNNYYFTKKIPIQDIGCKISDSLLLEELNTELEEAGIIVNTVVLPYATDYIRLCPCGTLNLGEICCKCNKKQGWWDSILDLNNLIKNRENRITKLREEEKIEEEKKIVEKRRSEENKNKIKQKWISIIKKSIPIVIVVTVLAIMGMFIVDIFIPSSNYKKAMEYYNNEEYEMAEQFFAKAGNYKDAKEYEQKSIQEGKFQELYQKACVYYQEKKYDEARELFIDLVEMDYKDSAEYYNKIVMMQYETAQKLFSEENYKESYYAFDKLGDYKDSIEKKNESIKIIIEELNYNDSRWTSYIIQDGIIVDTDISEDDTPQRIEQVNKVNKVLSKYSDIIAIDGKDSTNFAALKSNGNCILIDTSMGIEDEEKYHIQDDFWSNMKYVTTLSRNTMCAVGVSKDGKVKYEGWQYEENLKVIKDWEELAVITGDGQAVLGLKTDGTVLGARIYDKVDDGLLASTWKDVVQVDAGADSVFGLNLNGHVYVEKTGMAFINVEEIEKWSNVKKITVCGLNNCVALKEDGSLYSSNGLPDIFMKRSDIVNVFGSRYKLYAELEDGTCLVEQIGDYN